MREFFKPILIMGFLALFTSCTSDDNKSGEQDSKTTEIIIPTSMSIIYPEKEATPNQYTFEYKNETSSVLSKINVVYSNQKTELITHIYEGGKLVKFQNLYEGKSSSTNIKYDNDNRITSIKGNSSYFLKYNKDGLITSVIPYQEENADYYSFTYNNSKSINKSEVFSNGRSTEIFTTFEYDDKNTPFKNSNIKMDLMNQYDILFVTMFNQNNNHNIINMTYSNQGKTTGKYTYDYTYNTQNYPIKIIKTEVGGGIKSITTYEYKTITE